MANWQTGLELRDVYHEGKPIPELAAIVAKRLRNVPVPGGDISLEDERDQIAECFEELAEDERSTPDDFDAIMAELYDWADTVIREGWPQTRLCHVRTR